MRDCLEASKFRCSSADSTNVLAVLKIELWLVKLLTALKLCLVLFRILKVELDGKRVILDFVSIALLQVPEGLFLVAVKDVLAS